MRRSHFWRLTQPDYEATVACLQQAIDTEPGFCAGAGAARLCSGVCGAHGMGRQGASVAVAGSMQNAPSPWMTAIPGAIRLLAMRR